MGAAHKNAPAGMEARTEAQGLTEGFHSEAQAPEHQIGKRLATVQARAAILGGAVHPSTDDHGRTVYIVTRWAYTRELPSLDEVETLLNRMEGRR